MSRPTRRSLQLPPAPQRTGAEATARRVIFIIAIIAIVAVSIFAAIQLTKPEPSTSTSAPPMPQPTTTQIIDDSGDPLVRSDSHKLNDLANPQAVFVEFLDFECDTCSYAFPDVEKLSQEYGDRVSFVIRYFPQSSHFNAMRAARAVEAAAQQGQFLPMATRVFETQPSWINRQTPIDDLLRGFASELGFDMEKWEAVYNDDVTVERIQRDYNDGLNLGVQATPTFFLNGQQIQPRNYDQMVAMIEESLQQ